MMREAKDDITDTEVPIRPAPSRTRNRTPTTPPHPHCNIFPSVAFWCCLAVVTMLDVSMAR
eukprot:3767832-Rhodomonas_salina.1